MDLPIDGAETVSRLLSRSGGRKLGGTELLPETAFRREVEERRSALARRR